MLCLKFFFQSFFHNEVIVICYRVILLIHSAFRNAYLTCEIYFRLCFSLHILFTIEHFRNFCSQCPFSKNEQNIWIAKCKTGRVKIFLQLHVLIICYIFLDISFKCQVPVIESRKNRMCPCLFTLWPCFCPHQKAYKQYRQTSYSWSVRSFDLWKSFYPKTNFYRENWKQRHYWLKSHDDHFTTRINF